MHFIYDNKGIVVFGHKPNPIRIEIYLFVPVSDLNDEIHEICEDSVLKSNGIKQNVATMIRELRIESP